MLHTHHTTHTSQPRLKVTFSDPDNAQNEQPSNAIESKLKENILQRFQSIHEEYNLDKLPTLVTTLLRAHGMLQSRGEVWVLSQTGIWEQSRSSVVLKIAVDALISHSHDQYQRYRGKIEQALGRASANVPLKATVLSYLDELRDTLHKQLVAMAQSHKFEVTVLPQALKLINDDHFETNRDAGCDVVAAAGQLYRLDTSRSVTPVTLREDMKQLYVTKSLPLPLPCFSAGVPTAVARPPPVFSALEPSLTSYLQTILGQALLTNRIPRNTAIQFIGAGALTAQLELETVAGSLAA